VCYSWIMADEQSYLTFSVASACMHADMYALHAMQQHACQRIG
jgi:hypothetical protein